MASTESEVGEGLLGSAKVARRDLDIAERQPAETSHFPTRVEDDGREKGGYLRVEADPDASLDCVLGVDEGVDELDGVGDGFTV